LGNIMFSAGQQHGHTLHTEWKSFSVGQK
jgi:hypothetical protein